METAPDKSDGAAAAHPEEDEISVRVTLSREGERAWLRLKGSTLTAEVPPGAMASVPTGILALDVGLTLAGALASSQTVSVSVDAEEAIVLPPGRRLTSGHLMALIPAMLFGLVAVVLTIVSLADPHEGDLGLAAAFWILCAISLAPALPSVLKGRSTARIKLGRKGPLIECWHRPGSRKQKALDAFFFKLLQVQGWLHKLLLKRPQHEPAWRMYIEYYVRRGDFGAAFVCCDTMEAQGLAVSPRIRDAVARFRQLSEGAADSESRGPDEEKSDGTGTTPT